MSKPLYLYLDLETPGLIPELGILEVAWFVTENLLELGSIFSGINRDVDVDLAFDQSVDFVKNMHLKNGLWADLREVGKTEQLFDIEDAIVQELGDWKGPIYLVGNSIRLDRAFIERWMPRLSARLHYRQLDLTSVRLFLEALGIDTTRPEEPGKHVSAHRARADIEDSLLYAQHLAGLVKGGQDGAIDVSTEPSVDHGEPTGESLLIGGPLHGLRLRSRPELGKVDVWGSRYRRAKGLSDFQTELYVFYEQAKS